MLWGFIFGFDFFFLLFSLFYPFLSMGELNEVYTVEAFSTPREHTTYYSHIFSLLLLVVEAVVDSLAFMTVLYIL